MTQDIPFRGEVAIKIESSYAVTLNKSRAKMCNVLYVNSVPNLNFYPSPREMGRGCSAKQATPQTFSLLGWSTRLGGGDIDRYGRIGHSQRKQID